jgi:hypothetical protein
MFFDANEDPDWGSGNLFDPGSRIQDGKKSYLGSGINIPDPQQCKKLNFFTVLLLFLLI